MYNIDVMEYVKLGNIIGSFGLDGTLKVFSTTYFQEDRYQTGNKIFLLNPTSKETKELTVVSFRVSGNLDYVLVNEITTKEEAESLKGYELVAIKDKLNEGLYYYSDLEKMSVYDEEGNLLGKVKKVEEFPAQITLRISREKKADFFVPFIDEFILNIDKNNNKITIKVIGGMLWELQS